ncbi:hypothetical protein ONZ45_g10031 [Pleurotus djamor]|nr:hypothetical protein ONZ45_g10031 [Pleurotus djamor]
MCLGSPVFVSWLIVLIRKYYFAKSFKHIITRLADENAARVPHPEGRTQSFAQAVNALFNRRSEADVDGPPKLRAEMIRRVNDEVPKPVNPSGWISEGASVASPEDSSIGLAPLGSSGLRDSPQAQASASRLTQSPTPSQKHERRLSEPGSPSQPASLVNFPRYDTTSRMPRTQTVEFAPQAMRRRGHQVHDMDIIERRRSTSAGGSITEGATMASHSGTSHPPPRIPGTEDFGGFPMPFELIAAVFRRLFPDAHSRLSRTLTLPATTTITTQQETPTGARPVSYLGFDATVGRNSAFHHLTSEQLDELGGVEYRALNALLWIVAGYHIGLQVLGFVIIAPYMSTSRWRTNFEPPALHQPLASPWFSLFQTVSAYTNTGMSLVDQSMLPFQRAYPMILVMFFLVLAGNTAFPIFLRFAIWVISKCITSGSRLHRTLQFLLDHPRRCFIYLFPSHQTWFLLTVLFGLTFTDWFFFIVLDLNSPEIASIPLGTRCIVGLMQAVAVRAAGFGSVVLSALAPAVKFLYVIMMYISVFPIAMSVRTTNVYEDKSLGIYTHDDEDDDEDEFEPVGSRVEIWGRYLSMHIRKQLAFDMWWIALAIFVVCIIEQNNLENPENYGWFNIFNVVFELVSAYGTVGLSFGAPTTNASFCAVFHPLSKLVLCAVMIRGRHRGLPVAIDHAVILPEEFKRRTDLLASRYNTKDSGANV